MVPLQGSHTLQTRCSQADPAAFTALRANAVQVLSAQLLLDESLSRTGPLSIISSTSLRSSALIYLVQDRCYFNGLSS